MAYREQLSRDQRKLLRIIFRSQGGARYDEALKRHHTEYQFARRSMTALERKGFVRFETEVRGTRCATYVYCTKKGEEILLGEEERARKSGLGVMSNLTTKQKSILVALYDDPSGLTYEDVAETVRVPMIEVYGIISYLKNKELVRLVHEFRDGAAVEKIFIYCTSNGRRAMTSRCSGE